jgi:hypothetical protein
MVENPANSPPEEMDRASRGRADGADDHLHGVLLVSIRRMDPGRSNRLMNESNALERRAGLLEVQGRELRLSPILARLERTGWLTGRRALCVERRSLHRLRRS